MAFFSYKNKMAVTRIEIESNQNSISSIIYSYYIY